MPARLSTATRQMFDRLGPHFSASQRAVFANLWLLRPLVIRTLQQAPSTNAMVRTTTAVTIFQGGTKDNVLPSYARAAINFRILQGDSIAGVMEHVRRTINDPRVELRVAGKFSSEPSPVSPPNGSAFRILERTIRRVYPDVIVAPYLVVVVPDGRYFAHLTQNVFRFLPWRMTQTDLARMHGTNERVGVRDYQDAARFYHQLILDASAPAVN